MADQQIINTIRKYIFLLNNEGFGISKVFLYGSFAKEKNSESSDIDLMLVSNIVADDDVLMKAQAWVLTSQVDSRIEPYLVNNNRFTKDESSPLLEIVRKEGIEIKF